MTEALDRQIDWLARREGDYYGDGTASLCRRVAEALNPDMNAEEAANATYDVLKAVCAEQGMDPDIEVGIRSPDQNTGFPHGNNCHVVSWESGPFEWAIAASMCTPETFGKLVEPYYSFDLCFYPDEDY